MGIFVGGLVLGFLLGLLDQWLRQRRRQLEAEIAEIQALRREVRALTAALAEAQDAQELGVLVSRLAVLNGHIQRLGSERKH